MLTNGSAAPNVILKTMDGEPVSLAELRRDGQHTLLIFLRHLG